MASGQFGGTMCSPVDQTFYCRMSRFTGEIEMVTSLVIIPAVMAFYLYTMYKTKKGKSFPF